MNKKNIVLDTNVLLISIPTKSKYRPIFDALLNNEYNLLISNEILSEYREVIEEKTNSIIADNISKLLLSLPNVIKTNIYFKWQLISQDYDDNKFVDTYIAGNASYIISNDKHFNVLADIKFPKIKVIKIDEFLEKMKR